MKTSTIIILVMGLLLIVGGIVTAIVLSSKKNTAQDSKAAANTALGGILNQSIVDQNTAIDSLGNMLGGKLGGLIF